MDPNTENEKALEAANGTIAKLTEEVKGLKNAVADLIKEKNALQAKLDALLESSKNEITRLSTELDSAKRVADQHEPTITVGQKSFIVHGKNFTWKGEEYSVEQLLKNKELQAQLVKAQVGFLQAKA